MQTFMDAFPDCFSLLKQFYENYIWKQNYTSKLRSLPLILIFSIFNVNRRTLAVVSYQATDANVRIRLAPQPPAPAIGETRIIQ